MNGTGDLGAFQLADIDGIVNDAMAADLDDQVIVAAAAADWEERLSWEDSERFDGDDSVCSSPYSDSGSMCQNWRGWSAATASSPSAALNVGGNGASHNGGGGGVGASTLTAATATLVPPSYTGGLTSTPISTSVGVGGGSSSTLASPLGAGSTSPGRTNAVLPLVELAAKRVAADIPFEVVERFHLTVPENLQLRIAHWSFPGNEEEVRLYSCLANGNVDEFNKGQTMFENGSVENLLQIGFHLSGIVANLAQQLNSRNNSHNLLLSQTLTSSSSSAAMAPTFSTSGAGLKKYNVEVTLDRCKITSCSCTCNPNVSWCAHVVAICLHRIHKPSTVCFRAPLSESLSRMEKEQLQKFSQYFISELPRYFLPTAQKLIDALLSQKGPMNLVRGAPDPTAGASLNDVASWCLEEQTLHENIKKILHKFCQPTPTVCDVNYLSSNAPPAASEWTALLRPLRGREPEGLFNLLSIVQEMYCRHDRNAVSLLNIITQECLACDQVVLWWFHTKLLQCCNVPQLSVVHAAKPPSSSTSSSSNVGGPHAPSSQYSCATLFDAIVVLWRLAALNPCLSEVERRQFFMQVKQYHVKAVEKVFKILNDLQPSARHMLSHTSNNTGASGTTTNQNAASLGSAQSSSTIGPYGQVSRTSFSYLLLDPNTHVRFDLDSFPGFKSALEVCAVDDFWAPIAAPSFDGDDSSLNDALAECCASLRQSARRSSFVAAGKSLPSTAVTSSVPAYNSSSLKLTVPLNSSAAATPPARSPGARSSIAASLAPSVKMTVSVPRDDIEKLYMSEPPSDDDLPSSPADRAPAPKNAVELAEEALSFLQPVCDRVDLLFARCEGLAAHGCAEDACRLAAHLARHLCASVPNWLSAPGPEDVSVTVTSTSEPPTTLRMATNSPLPVEPSGTVKFSVDGCGGPTMSANYTGRLGSPPDRPSNVNNQSNNLMQQAVNGTATHRKKNVPTAVLVEPPCSTKLTTETNASANFSSTLASSCDMAGDSAPTPSLQRRLPSENARLSALASGALTKAHFLFNVLYQDKSKHKLAFNLGLWAMQILRQPAASKFLEVKLYHQEMEMMNNLKRLELGHEEMNLLRESASKFRNGFYSSKPLSVLPLSLAAYLFDCLCGAGVGTGSSLPVATNSPAGTKNFGHFYKTLKDDQLGFEAAVAALSLKSNMAEAEHPLLCEGIRRQKGELALSLLLRYKDDSSRVALIMDQLLDFEMHRMYKHHTSNAIPFVNGNVGHQNKAGGACGATVAVTSTTYICSAPLITPSTALSPPVAGTNNASGGGNSLASSRRSSFGGNAGGGTPSIDGAATETSDVSDVLEELMLSEENRDDDGNVDWSHTDASGRRNSAAVDGSRTARMPSCDSSSADSSSSGVSRDVSVPRPAPSTRNPPASAAAASTARRNVFRADRGAHPASSSHSLAFNNSPAGPSTSTMPKSIDPLNKNRYMKISRQRKYVTPSVPNQPSEAHAHFMGELAKRLLTEAGGSHSTAIFTTPQGGPQANQAHGGGPHRALHLCAFQIGLYALGLHNKVTPNWLSRTYSSHVSWISGQAMEIGRMAIHVLIASWENHLTPTEVANLADKGSQSRDPAMVSASAELALSALSQAHALSQPDIQRALSQCREQNSQMLIKACLAVEQAAKDGGVYPDVLFKVGQQWHHMYTESLAGDQQQISETLPPSLPAHHSSSHQHLHQHHQLHHHPHTPRAERTSFAAIVGDSAPIVAVPTQQPPQPSSYVDVVVMPPPPTLLSTSTSHFTTQPPPPFHVAQMVAALPSAVGSQPTVPRHFGHGPPLPLSFQHPNKGNFGASFESMQQQQCRQAMIGPASAPNPAIFGRSQPAAPSLPPAPQNVNGCGAAFAPFPIIGQPPPSLMGGTQLVQRHVSLAGRAPTHFIVQHQQLGSHGGSHHSTVPMVMMTSSGLMSMPQQHHQQFAQFGSGVYGPIPNRMAHGHIDVSMSHPPPPTPAPSRDPLGNNCYLYAAYRVGMLALETLGRRIHDERSYVKYAQNPPYGDDVKWLLGVSRKLGPAYVQQFCSAAVQAVVSPFVLWDVARETAIYFAPRAPGSVAHHTAESARLWLTKALSHPCVQPLMQRCMQTFSAAAHQKLSHPRFMQSDAEEVCNLVRAAHTAFHHSNDSFQHASKNFDDFMQSLRRQKACKKDLWARLMNLVNVC